MEGSAPLREGIPMKGVFILLPKECFFPMWLQFKSENTINALKMSAILCLFLALNVVPGTIADADWIAMAGHGGAVWTDGAISSLIYGNDGCLYVGGTFEVIDNFISKGAAKWDGSTWRSLASRDYVKAIGLDDAGNVYSVIDSPSSIYTSATAIQIVRQWDSTNNTWKRIGNTQKPFSNVPPTRFLSDKKGNLLFIGNQDPGSSVIHNIPRISKWNHKTWTDLDSAISIGAYPITASAVDSSGALYICGRFTEINGVRVNGFGKWDGTRWSPFGVEGKNIAAMATDDLGNIFVGGSFDTIGGIHANNIAAFSGGAWFALGSGANGMVTILTAAKNGHLYAYGSFDTIGGIAAKNIAMWDGTTWSTLGIGIKDVSSMACGTGDMLYAGGTFDSSGGIYTPSIARWNGARWEVLQSQNPAPDILGDWYYPETYGGVYSCVTDKKGNLYVGGFFNDAGGVAVNSIAKWNGISWDSLSSGIGGWNYGFTEVPGVYALAFDTVGNLYAAGNFHAAGNSTANCISKWDGRSWHALNTGLSETVFALSCDNGGNLYAGGTFTRAGNAAAGGIVKWNGIGWDSLGGGFDKGPKLTGLEKAAVLAITCAKNGTVYAGGNFNFAFAHDDFPIYLAKWNGASWSSCGLGLNNGWVSALAQDDFGTIYAGGSFVLKDSTTVLSMAQWDGTTWIPLIANQEDVVIHSLAIDRGGNVYAGGHFSKIGTISARNIAKWDGKNWSALGSGVDSVVYSLCIFDSTLYAGGLFKTAGNKLSPTIAAVNIHTSSNNTFSRQPLCSCNVIRWHILKSTIVFSGIVALDRISLFSLSSRLLHESEGVSRINLSHLSPQPLIVRVNRAGKIVSTGMVMKQ